MKPKDLKDIQDSGFKIPTGYLEEFEDSILKLASLKEKVSDSGFSIPEGYFDSVESKILSQIPEKESRKVISLINKKSIIYATSIAASLVLMFNLIDFNTKIDINSIETSTIESYLNSEDFDSDELAALLIDSDFLDDSFDTMNFSEEAIEDYVYDNLELDDLYIE
jgi:hypothetical protein